MEGMRPIGTVGYRACVVATTFGKPARLEWLPINRLVVDPEYQRDITSVGRRNVERIARQFNWAMFTPVVVSSVGSNRFAIVDGQHRTTAAALCGIEKVPCCIIEAKRGEQAAAFKAINGNVTRMHTTALLQASIAAGEPEAVQIAAVAARAGVTILRYPRPVNAMGPRETIAVTSIRKIIERFGDDHAVLTLSLLANAGGAQPGSLKQQSIIGTAEVLADHPEWMTDTRRLREAFSDLDIPSMLMEAFEQSARRKGVSKLNAYEAALLDALSESFTGAAA